MHDLSQNCYQVMGHDLNDREKVLHSYNNVLEALKRIKMDDEHNVQILLELAVTPLGNI